MRGILGGVQPLNSCYCMGIIPLPFTFNKIIPLKLLSLLLVLFFLVSTVCGLSVLVGNEALELPVEADLLKTYINRSGLHKIHTKKSKSRQGLDKSPRYKSIHVEAGGRNLAKNGLTERWMGCLAWNEVTELPRFAEGEHCQIWPF